MPQRTGSFPRIRGGQITPIGGGLVRRKVSANGKTSVSLKGLASMGGCARAGDKGNAVFMLMLGFLL